MNRFLRKTRRAAVLGCGPAGLFAAHALIGRGWDVSIYSRKRRSEMYGAQYLHAPIPGLTDGQEPVTIRYRLNGSADDYRQKVYGFRAVKVSPESLAPEHEAWDIRAAYYRAWTMYSERIRDVPNIDSQFLGASMSGVSESLDLQRLDWVVSSIPANRICYQPEAHQFESQEVYAIGDAPERGIFCPITSVPDNTVLLDGTRQIGWYRASNVFGYRTAEWPAWRKPPIHDLSLIEKPVSNNCDCYDGKGSASMLKVGRYGRWEKAELSHRAYERAMEL